MATQDPIPFGDRYLLVEHIATGGMAEIYRAQYTGIEGFAKELVIKQLRDEFAARPEIVAMFLDEARVAATLTHANVVHTYDLGELDGRYYIAMEFLRGQELVNVLRRAVSLGRSIPIEIAIGVAMQALEGLHYVHERRNDKGEELGLVHRDINPTNIHVGYDGVCKILDFGIAATRATAVARAGEFAGKLSYMAPEQIDGHPLDRRADIFALGVVLYEMCLGRRLFRGPRDEVISRIRRGDVPAPTYVDPSFPPSLEAILMKALEVDPEERYQNCDHMFRDLEAFLAEVEKTWSPRKASAYMAELFGEGAPAQVRYDDVYGDLVDEALDFERYETIAPPSEAGDDAPVWAREVEGGDAGTTGRRAVMTIGHLEALSVDESADTEARDGAGADRDRDGARSHRNTGSSARVTGSGRRVAATSTGRRSAVPAAGPSPAFGQAVVSSQVRPGGLLGWIFGVGALLGLAYLAYTALNVR